MILDELQLKFPEIFIGTPLGPVIVGSVFMLGQRWHLGAVVGTKYRGTFTRYF